MTYEEAKKLLQEWKRHGKKHPLFSVYPGFYDLINSLLESQKVVDAEIIKTEMEKLYESLSDGELLSIPDYASQLQQKILNTPDS